MIYSERISDPDLLHAAIRGAHLDPCQLSSGTPPSLLSRVVLPGMCLDLVRLGPAMLFTGQMPKDCYTILFVLACPSPAKAFNFSMDYTAGYVGFWAPGGLLDSSTPEGYVNATLTVPVAAFRSAVAVNWPEIPDPVLASGAGVRVGPVEQAAFRRLLAVVEEAVRFQPESLADAFTLRQLQEELLAVFISALRSGWMNGRSAPAPRAGGRMEKMRQARDFIAAHVREPISLNDLCKKLALSRRGVENLFRDLLGVNPLTYLRHQRLHGVRRDLLGTRPAAGVVKEKALDWGFRHLGRFAGDYQELFGEFPNATLARGKAC